MRLLGAGFLWLAWLVCAPFVALIAVGAFVFSPHDAERVFKEYKR